MCAAMWITAGFRASCALRLAREASVPLKSTCSPLQARADSSISESLATNRGNTKPAVGTGPGIFATAGASNPTYTIFALSLRGAEHLAANWKTLAG